MIKAIILGASGGIGSALLQCLNSTESGQYHICALGRRILENKWMSDVTGLYFDLQTPDFTELDSWLWEEQEEAAEEVVLVLAAGTITPLDLLDMISMEALSGHIHINVMGMAMLVSHVAKQADIAGAGLKIIQLDSGAAYRPIKGWGLYCSAKAYISMYLQVMQEEHPDYRIVLLDPGVVDTSMQDVIRNTPNKIFPDAGLFRDYKINGELRTPEYVAEKIVERYIVAWSRGDIKEKLD